MLIFYTEELHNIFCSYLKAFGVNVNCNFPQDKLMDGIIEKQRLLRKSGMNSNFLHPFDDINVIIGHGRYFLF